MSSQRNLFSFPGDAYRTVAKTAQSDGGEVFELVDGPFIYLLSMCLDVRCPKTRWFHTRMIFRKSAGPLILLTSTPCSFGLAGGLSFVGSKFEPTVFGRSYTQNLIQKHGRVFASSLSKASEHDLKNRYQPLRNFCRYSDHSLYIFSRKMLIRWILVSWYPLAKNQSHFFCEKRCKLVYIYTSPISISGGS